MFVLKAKLLILPEEPMMSENPTAQQKKIWDLRTAAVVNNEDTPRKNMEQFCHFSVTMWYYYERQALGPWGIWQDQAY